MSTVGRQPQATESLRDSERKELEAELAAKPDRLTADAPMKVCHECDQLFFEDLPKVQRTQNCSDGKVLKHWVDVCPACRRTGEGV